jgi:hypothetical protein
VANAGKGRRSRKRRPGPSSASSRPASAPPPRQKTPPPPTSTFGERPRAPWHPWPLAEILIVVGAIGTIVGLRELSRASSHSSQGRAPLATGLVAVCLGVVDVIVREHWSGYRSHATLLALLPVVALHAAIVVGASAVAHPTQLLTILLLPVDVALYALLFKLLRSRFLDARQLRALGRR